MYIRTCTQITYMYGSICIISDAKVIIPIPTYLHTYIHMQHMHTYIHTHTGGNVGQLVGAWWVDPAARCLGRAED